MYNYEATLDLRETSGRSGVSLSDLRLSSRGGTEESDCAPLTVHIDAGASWSLRSLSYCAPYVWASIPLQQVTFQATVRDDSGALGQLRLTTTVQP